MKKLLILCGFISIVNSACAQKVQKTPAQRAEYRTHLLEKQLTLSKEQARQVKVIMLDKAIRIDSLKANRQAANRNRRKARQLILAQTDAKMEMILSADQDAAYLRWKELKKQNRNTKSKRGGINDRPKSISNN